MDQISQCSSCQRSLPLNDELSKSNQATNPISTQTFCESCLIHTKHKEIVECPIDPLGFSTDGTNLNQKDSGEENQQLNLENRSEDEKQILNKKENLDELQRIFEQHITRAEFERQVLFEEEEKLFEKIFENDRAPCEDISKVLNQLCQGQITPEFLKAYDQESELNSCFQQKGEGRTFVEDNLSFREGQNILIENLKKFERPSLDILKTIERKSLSPEIMNQVSKLYKSQAEAMFMIICKTGLLRFEISDEEWLVVYPSMGKEDREAEIGFEKIKDFEKVDVKFSREEDIYLMVLGVSFLLENCLEKASNIYLNFCKRYITDKETKIFNGCALWKNDKIKSLTLDFTECTFETEETPVILLQDKTIQLENLEELKLVLNDSNATCKTIRNFHKEVVPRLKSLKSFELSFSGLPFSNQEISEISQESLQRMNNLEILSLELEKTLITDEGISLLFETELSNLKNLKSLKLWLNNTQITAPGFLSIFRGLQRSSFTQNLEVFALGLDESNVSDGSLLEFADSVLPLMKSLKKFWIWVDDTSVTDKSLIPLCQNIKHFAANLKVFVLSATGTSATDEMVDVFTLETLPLMKNVEHFHFWFPGPNITDQSLKTFFEVLSKGILANAKKLWLSFGETAVTDEGLIVFAEKVVPTLMKLQEIHFSGNTRISDSSLRPLFENLSVAKDYMRNLTISLNETEIGEQSILALAETLAAMKNLRTLSLGLSQTNLGDSCIGPLFVSFNSFAKNLQRLTLMLEGTKITDQSMLSLGNEFKLLREFQLWASYTEIGDVGLKSLFENLKGTMMTMEKLRLFLTQTLVTDEGLLSLAEVVSSGAKSIQEFDLWAIDTKISDVDISPLMGSLENSARNIRKLILALAGSEITDVACEVLCEKVIRNMCNLQELKVFLGRTQVTDANLIPLFERLAEKARNVRVFEFQFNDMNTDNSVGVLAKKVLPNLIRAQELRLYWTAELSDLTYRNLCVNTHETIRNVDTFQISNSHFSVTTDSRKPFLQEIQFELNDVIIITDRIMTEILQSFGGKVSQVKSFSFQVNRTQVSHGSLEALGTIFFSQMSNLESLILELEGVPLQVEAFCLMCQNLQCAVTNLKLFRIQLEMAQEIGGSCLVNLAEYGLSKMKSLESLTIKIRAQVSSEEDAMTVLLMNLQHSAKTLQYFELYLEDTKLSTEGIQALGAHTFLNFENLETFSLGLFSTGIKDEDFAALFFSLTVKNVTSFSFIIDEKNITDITMDNFSSLVLPQLTNLGTLKTLFGGAKFGNESLKKFNKKLQEICHRIQNLSFKFGQNSITSEAVDEFALNILPTMKNLKTVEVGFGDNLEVNNEAIVNLFGGLRKIIGGLTSLELDLSKTGFTDLGVEAFKEQLAGELEHLERFEMNISENEVSEENREFISQLVKY